MKMNKILLTIYVLTAVARPTVLGKWKETQEIDKYIALGVQLVCMVMLRIHWNVTNTGRWFAR